MQPFNPSRRNLFKASGALAASALIPGQSATAADSAANEISADDVRKAIAWGADYLKRHQDANGTWPNQPHYAGGLTPLCTLALLHCGCTPQDEVVSRSLTHLRSWTPTATYAAALQTMVFCAAEPAKDLLLIQRNVKWLESRQVKEGDNAGAWSTPFPTTPDHTDNSMTHFAMLALYEAERAGVEVNEIVWRRALGYWQRLQNDDGSWGWGPENPGTGSMTCAGIAAIIIASGQLNPGDATVDGDQVLCCRPQTQNPTLEKALAWMERSFSVQRNPGAEYWHSYYLYSLERAARMTARRFIGGHDWFREGVQTLVQSQRSFLTGAWPADVEFKPVNDLLVSTCFSLMFLSKGRWPVVLAHLQHEPQNDWNRHRSALFNLISHVERTWEMNLTFQTVDIARATLDELLETPIVFLSGQNAPEFTAAEKQKLRGYLDRGGFLFAVQSCEGGTFDSGFRALVKELLHEPESQLRPLPADHPLWHMEEAIDFKYLPELWAVDAGCRTAVVYCPTDLTALWELARVGREKSYSPAVQAQIRAARAVGLNTIAFATNREVKFKNPAALTPRGDGEDRNFERGVLYVANILHAGGCKAAPAAVDNLLQILAEKYKLRTGAVSREVQLSDPNLFNYAVVFMHGRRAFSLADAERNALRAYLLRGGILFANAICSNTEFRDSFRREIADLFPGQALQRIPPGNPLFTAQLGGEDIVTVAIRETPLQLIGERVPTKVRKEQPNLEGLWRDDHFAVLFSSYDISCALGGHESIQCEGYSRVDAAKIAVNVLFYALNH